MCIISPNQWMAAMLSAAMLWPWSYVHADELDFRHVATGLTDFGYIASKARWIWGPLEPKVIFVCWENPGPDFASQMRIVEDAVTESWQKHSQLRFQGWENKCAPANRGIRILISDEGVRTKELGQRVDGIPSGMTLNFTFSNWSVKCQDPANYQRCIRSIAVHEFGHAIGFAHEQNRPDTPGECAGLTEGENGDIELTPWDRMSVMNYCSVKYLNDGVLSAFDKQSVQNLYGKPGA